MKQGRIKYTPSGTVICPCGHTEYGVSDIYRHAAVGITMQLKRCQTCEHFKPATHSCSPVQVIEDDQSLRTKGWWDKVKACKGRIP